MEEMLSEPIYKYVKTAVITGTNEPMQNKEFVEDSIRIIKSRRPDIQVELQTRMYQPDAIYEELDVTCYSISHPSFLKTIKPVGKIIRYVIILTDDFDKWTLRDIIKMIPPESGVSQITFKVLQNSNGYNKVMDAWIEEHRASKEMVEVLKNDIFRYWGLSISVRMDEFCLRSENRYVIFRADGKIYKDWDTINPILGE